MDFSLRKITKDLLPAFVPYLLPQAAELINSEQGLIALGAVTGSQTCGAIAGHVENGELTIFSLFVDKQVRRRGVASMLLDALLNAASFDCVCARWILPEEEFLSAEAFFMVHGFSPTEYGDEIYRLCSDSFKNAPSLKSAFSPAFRQDGNIVSVSAFTEEEMRELLGDESIPSFLRLNNFSPKELSSPICLGYRYGGRICAYIICSISDANSVAMRTALSREGAPPAVFHLLTAAAIRQVILQLGEKFFVFISPVTAPAKRLTVQLSGGKYDIWREGSCQKKLT